MLYLSISWRVNLREREFHSIAVGSQTATSTSILLLLSRTNAPATPRARLWRVSQDTPRGKIISVSANHLQSVYCFVRIFVLNLIPNEVAG
jgi:hypothetical protein